MSNQQQQAGVEVSDLANIVLPEDAAIKEVFKKWAGVNENGVPYLTTYEESFRLIAYDLIAADRQQRGKGTQPQTNLPEPGELSDADLIAIAKYCAASNSQGHSYAVLADQKGWSPHGWVLDAMRAAIKKVSSDLQASIDDLQVKLDEANRQPWPEWAEKVLQVIREHSGYDGYDDMSEGIDLAAELDEVLNEIASDRAQRVKAEPVAYWIPKTEQFCFAPKDGSRPFAKAWEPLFAEPVFGGCLACVMRDKAISQKPSTEVTPAYLDWLKLNSQSSGVAGNVAWNAGVEWAQTQAQPAPAATSDVVGYVMKGREWPNQVFYPASHKPTDINNFTVVVAAEPCRVNATSEAVQPLTKFDPRVPNGDKLREIATQAKNRNGPSDGTSPWEYVLEGWREAEKYHGIGKAIP